jgi:hypothetical protein
MPEYRATDFVLFASAPGASGQFPEPVGAADTLAQKLLALPAEQRPPNFHIVTADRAADLGPKIKGIMEGKKNLATNQSEGPLPKRP